VIEPSEQIAKDKRRDAVKRFLRSKDGASSVCAHRIRAKIAEQKKDQTFLDQGGSEP
jgi:hypothetical protein